MKKARHAAEGETRMQRPEGGAGRSTVHCFPVATRDARAV